jgi:hypothetical protein
VSKKPYSSDEDVPLGSLDGYVFGRARRMYPRWRVRGVGFWPGVMLGRTERERARERTLLAVVVAWLWGRC